MSIVISIFAATVVSIVCISIVPVEAVETGTATQSAISCMAAITIIIIGSLNMSMCMSVCVVNLVIVVTIVILIVIVTNVTVDVVTVVGTLLSLFRVLDGECRRSVGADVLGRYGCG